MAEAAARLDAHARRRLLELARTAIAAHLESRRVESGPESGELTRPCGAFVTLKRDGDLRGCIGHMRSERPLYEVVAECAISAATSDPRFPALEPSELAEVVIDVSVLSPLVPIRAEQVEVGRHGVMIEHGGRRGVFLPQVASEQGWDREALLRNLCRKAGLAESAWREDDVILLGFTAEVFGEEPAHS